MLLVDLPNDLFLLIVAHLSPKDLVCNRRVNRQFYAAFTEDELNRHLLIDHFPRVRELREKDGDCFKPYSTAWPDIFSRVASRYHYLKEGRPRSIEKYALKKSFVLPEWSRSYAVASWRRHLRFEERTAPFHYAETLWTYEDGVLVFPSVALDAYTMLNLNTGKHNELDIGANGKIVRRLRLKSKVLLVEWCEQDAYHQLNANEAVHRHFATAYDIEEDCLSGKLQASLR